MPVLSFKRRAPSIATEVARLGEIIVGEVYAFPGVRHRASWVVRLPDTARPCGPAPSFEAARKRIEEHVVEWLERASVLTPGAGVRVEIEEEQNQ